MAAASKGMRRKRKGSQGGGESIQNVVAPTAGMRSVTWVEVWTRLLDYGLCANGETVSQGAE